MRQKSVFLSLLLWAAVLGGVLFPVLAEEAGEQVTMGTLLGDLLEAWEHPSAEAEARIDADVEALQDEVAAAVAAHWKRVYLDPDYRLYYLGKDDPAELPVTGRHAFVILGYELENGEMREELKGRCDAAAAAAKAFPDSIIVCSGGATGQNNPDQHTEAGMMKAYLTEVHGIEPARILTDERAMTTAENALNTMAILQEQGIETMTIVTSSYHQKWGQVLYNLVAAQYGKEHQYHPEILGNYCYEIEPENERFREDARIAVSQAARILGVKTEYRNGDSGERKHP